MRTAPLRPGQESPVISRSRVVLPEPFGPVIATRSGPVMAKLRFADDRLSAHRAAGQPVELQHRGAVGEGRSARA